MAPTKNGLTIPCLLTKIVNSFQFPLYQAKMFNAPLLQFFKIF